MRYESAQKQILKPANVVYLTLSKFSNFTPILADKVEDWQADDDTCSFKAKGFTVALKMTERIENQLIKIGQGEGTTPFPFSFFLQIKEVEQNDTRIKITLDAELNMMMKMMVGSKMQKAVDAIADQIAAAFNQNNPNF